MTDLRGRCEGQFDNCLLLNSTLSTVPHKHPMVGNIFVFVFVFAPQLDSLHRSTQTFCAMINKQSIRQ